MDTLPSGACGPFVKTFRTAEGRYIYDVNSNQLVRTDDLGATLVEHLRSGRVTNLPSDVRQRYGDEVVARRSSELEAVVKERSLFGESRPKVRSNLDPTALRSGLDSGLQQLILELTQACNLACRYCVYSGSYPLERTHTTKRMTPETARRAIDFFLARSNSATGLLPVGFYGGEPLLNPLLLKHCVEYATRLGGDRVDTHVTTNGTLLDEDMARFFIAKHVRVTVSLGGPRGTHDRWRKDGKRRGSYARVRAALDLMRRLDRDYFDHKVSLNAVLAPPLELDTLNEFFFENPEFAPLRERMRFNPICAPEESRFRDEHYREAEDASWRALGVARQRYEQALSDGRVEQLGVEGRLFQDAYFNIWSRPIAAMPETIAPRGFCTPGLRRLFVDCDGTFFTCEKMAGHLPIGDVERGFDVEAISRIYEAVDSLHERCVGCWAVRLCSKCGAELALGNEVSAEKFDRVCRRNREVLETDLVSYCQVLEKNPEAFKSFESIRVS